MTTTTETSNYFNLIAVGLTLAADGQRDDRFTPDLRRQAGAVMQVLSNSPDIALVLHAAATGDLEQHARPSWSAPSIGADVFGPFLGWKIGTLDASLQVRPVFASDDEDAAHTGWTFELTLPPESEIDPIGGDVLPLGDCLTQAAETVTDIARQEGTEVRGG